MLKTMFNLSVINKWRWLKMNGACTALFRRCHHIEIVCMLKTIVILKVL